MLKKMILVCVAAFLLSLSQKAEGGAMAKPVYVLDLWNMYAREGFDTLEKQANATYLITALQGLVNRDEAVLFLDASLNLFSAELDHEHIPNRDKQSDFESMDRRWLEWMQHAGLLDGRPIVEVESFEQLLNLFAGKARGLVLWDMETPASVNLALTVAGCENLLPVSPDLDEGFLQQKLKTVPLEIVRDFTGFAAKAETKGITGKEQVYLTMLNDYLKTGKADPGHMWFNVDAYALKPPVYIYGDNEHLGSRNVLQHNGLYNADYWIAKRGLFVDLYSLDIEAPNDDPEQVPGTDLRLWNDLLEESYKQRKGAFGVMGGFAPWWVKYSNEAGNSRPPIDAEQSFVRLATSYNLWNDADAAFGLANASFYCHLSLPPREEFSNPEVAMPELKQDTLYVCLIMLDFDGSAWLNQMPHAVYDHPGRGIVPLNWAINPILADRVPHVFRYLLDNRTDKDFFRIADDGAGYIDPYYLVGSNRTGRIKTDGFEEYCKAAKPYLDRLNMDLMAFYISDQGFTEDVLEPIADLTPAGMGLNRPIPFSAVAGVPVTYVPAHHHKQLQQFEAELTRLFERADSGLSQPEFYAYRLIIFRPFMITDPIERLRQRYPDAKVEFMDMHTFLKLKQRSR